jgi:hypothetical protein
MEIDDSGRQWATIGDDRRLAPTGAYGRRRAATGGGIRQQMKTDDDER